MEFGVWEQSGEMLRRLGCDMSAQRVMYFYSEFFF
jgi:hypothetical protein